jgi:hypothetical protein
MAVRALFAAAAVFAVTVAMLLPVPGAHSKPSRSQIPTMELSRN